MSKALLIAGGILNAVFFVFHIILGYQIHQLTNLPAPYRALMEALNLGGVLFLFFFSYASFFQGKELLQTGLGRAILALAAVLHLSRAAEEFFLFRFTVTVFVSCVLVGAIYVALFAIATKTHASLPANADLRSGRLRRIGGFDRAA